MSLQITFKKIQRIFFSPAYEVAPAVYFTEFLTKEDAQNLRPFVSDFGGKLSVSSAILAVGSSVFPQKYFNNLKKINRRDPTAQVDEAYRDIDLLVVPEAVVKLTDLEKSVQEALGSLGFEWKSHKTTAEGVSHHKQSDGTYAPFLHLDYGLQSISTNLRNGTKLDIILGRDDLMTQTAAQKIEIERKDNNAFSLLYLK